MVRKTSYSNKAFFDESKVIIITGASSGIGKALSLALVRYNPKLVLIARRKRQLLQTAKLLEKENVDVLPIVGDVRNREDRIKFVDFTMKKYGRIDVLVNNAGLGKANLIIDQPEEEIDLLIETNILSLIKMTKHVLPIMQQQESGIIINMSSSLALLPVFPFAVYCATKSAVKVFSDSIRQELKNYGISVSTVMPGSYETEFNKIAGIDEESVPGYAVEKLAVKIAKLVVKPKKNLIQPTSYVPLIWITKRFEFLKNLITLKIAQMINKARIESQIKIDEEIAKTEKEEIKLLVPDKRNN